MIPAVRLVELQAMNADALTLVATFAGDHEGTLHRHFAASRHHGEWFDSPLLANVDEIKKLISR